MSKEALEKLEKETIIYDDEERKTHYGTLGEKRKNLVELIKQDLEELEKYKSIEKELGCPIEVLIKAIKGGIWFINEYDKLEQIDEELTFNIKLATGKFIISNDYYCCKNKEIYKANDIYLEDYKKTWWLKEDKSE